MYQVLVIILAEFVELLVPFLVTAVELWLYYGPNKNAVPQLVALTKAEFYASNAAKLGLGFLILRRE